MMRLAFLADIHGNPIALDAVLADLAAQGGADEIWLLGDLSAIGPDPVGVLERLKGLPNVRFVQGNNDRDLATGGLPPPSQADAAHDPALIPIVAEVAASFAWTQGYLAASGWLDWFDHLPFEQRIVLPNGVRLLAVHVAPGRLDGDGIRPDTSDDALAALLAGCEADLVVTGHTHTPLDRTVRGVRAINPGSVSNPITADLRAKYALLEADAGGVRVSWRRVAYDRQAVIAAVERVRHPAGGFIVRYMRGENRFPWAVDEL